MSATFPTPTSATRDHLTSIRAGWGWFVALGVAFVLLGAVALGNMLLSTVVTALYVGVMMVIGGLVQVVHAFQLRTWGRFLFWLLAGVLYVVAGGLVISQPLLAAGIITLMIGVALVIGGAFRIFAAFGGRGTSGWGWLLFSGVISLLLGIEIIAGWPVNSVFILGLFLGIDLIINGVATALFGLSLRKAR